MKKFGQNCSDQERKKIKYTILLLPFYIMFYVVFIIILGLGVGDIWDKLTKGTKS